MTEVGVRREKAALFTRFKEQQRRVKPEGPEHGDLKDHERTL